MTERKTVQVQSDVKEELSAVKSHLGLSNESDTIKFLLRLFSESKSIPSEVMNQLLELRK